MWNINSLLLNMDIKEELTIWDDRHIQKLLNNNMDIVANWNLVCKQKTNIATLISCLETACPPIICFLGHSHVCRHLTKIKQNINLKHTQTKYYEYMLQDLI